MKSFLRKIAVSALTGALMVGSVFSNVALASSGSSGSSTGGADHIGTAGGSYSRSPSSSLDELTYSSDYFSDPYCYGYINLTSSGCHPSSSVSTRTDSFLGYSVYYGTNTSKNSKQYIDWWDGAYIDGVAYDVRVYFWKNSSNNYWNITSGGTLICDHARNGGTNYTSGTYYNYASNADYAICFEYHFYEHDMDATGDDIHKCGSNDFEVSFDGILYVDDLDRGEGYQFVQGAKKVYLTDKTNVQRYGRPAGQIDDICGGRTTTNNSGYTSNSTDCAWITVHSTAAKPLTMYYWTSGYFASEVGTSGQKVNYSIVGNQPCGVKYKITKSGVANYSNYPVRQTPEEADLYPGYAGQFSGWYKNDSFSGSPLTTGEIVKVKTSDVTLYGRWVYNVETSAGAGGRISNGHTSMEAGSSLPVFITPDDGYYISSLTVQYVDIDGELVTKSTYDVSTLGVTPGDSYTYGVTNIDRNYVLTAEFDTLVNLQTSVLNGTIDPTDGSYSYPQGTTVEVTYEPISSRYDLDKIYVDGEEVANRTGITSGYTFENMTSDHTIRVEYQPWYQITTEAINGSIDPFEDHIRIGSDRTISYAPLNENYRLTYMEIDYNPVEESDLETYASSYSFSNIEADHDVYVVYQPYRNGVIHFVDTNGNTVADDIEYEWLGEREDFSSANLLTDYINTKNEILANGFSLVSDDVADREVSEPGNGFLTEEVGGTMELTVVFEGSRYGIIHYVDTEGHALKADTTYSNIGNPEDFDDTATLAFYNQNCSDLIDAGYKIVSDEVANRDSWFLDEVDSTKEMTVVFELQPPVLTGIKQHPVSILCIMDLGLIGIFMSIYLKKQKREETDE